MSVGGGSIAYETGERETEADNNSFSDFKSISEYCRTHSISLWDYVKETESDGLAKLDITK